MLYRTMKKSDRKLSILGFGCMRLPQTPACHIDEGKATAMVRYAIDRGVNYLDTAYVYHNGESEPVLGRALHDGYRERVNLATKMPVWAVEKRQDMERFLDEQLVRLRTDHIDFYLLHGLVRSTFEKAADLGVFGFLSSSESNFRRFWFLGEGRQMIPNSDGASRDLCIVIFEKQTECTNGTYVRLTYLRYMVCAYAVGYDYPNLYFVHQHKVQTYVMGWSS